MTPPTVLNVTCGLVNLGHVDLDTGVVLGRQDAVAGRAFPGSNVTLLMVRSDISYQQYHMNETSGVSLMEGFK